MPLGTTELIIIAVVVMLLFGAKKLPQAAEGLGKAMRIFKKETTKLTSDDDEPAAPQQQAAPPQQLPASPVDTVDTTVNGVPLSQTDHNKSK